MKFFSCLLILVAACGAARIPRISEHGHFADYRDADPDDGYHDGQSAGHPGVPFIGGPANEFFAVHAAPPAPVRDHAVDSVPVHGQSPFDYDYHRF